MSERPPVRMFAVHMPGKELWGALRNTLYSGYLAEGPRVKEFEEALGVFIQNPCVAAVSSCTAAITIALRCAGVGRTSRVVTTPMTCTATNLPILNLGAEPVWADVDPYTGLIDPASVRDRMREQGEIVRATIAVDWGGTPCDLSELMEVVHARGRFLIEDAAHALGAWYEGNPVGTVSDMTCFSFQAIKHITTGDGGALSFAGYNKANIKRAKRLRWYGIDREAPAEDTRIDVDIDYEEVGYKANMNDITATIGLAQMQSVRSVVGAYRMNAMFYHRYLEGVVKPVEPQGRRSAYWVYTVLLPESGMQAEFRRAMAERGVQVSQVHRRNDQYTVFERWRRDDLPGLDYFSSRMMCLPCHWALAPQDLEHVVDSVHAVLGAGS